MKKKRSLTLLEIMIVIFLIGLISSVIGVNMKGSLDKGKEFKTKKGIEQIEEIILLEVAKGDLKLEDLFDSSGNADMEKLAENLRKSGMVKDPKKTLQDGWGEPFIIMQSGDEKGFEIVSNKLNAYEKKNRKDNAD